MTWYYVYAIVPATTSLPSDLRGIADEPLSSIPSGSLAAIVGERAGAESEPDAKSVIAHHRVVSRISEILPSLPVQFGTIVRGGEQLRTALTDREDVLRADLERLTGNVELGIIVLGEPMLPDDDRTRENLASTGSDYMRQRLDEYRQESAQRVRSEQIRTELESAIDGLILDRRIEQPPDAATVLRASYLIERSRSEDMVDLVEQVRKRHPDLEVVLVGPWPPYSFVSQDHLDFEGMFGAIVRE